MTIKKNNLGSVNEQDNGENSTDTGRPNETKVVALGIYAERHSENVQNCVVVSVISRVIYL